MTPPRAIDPVRHALWLALGLLTACPKDPVADPDETTAVPPGTTTGTTAAPTTGLVATGTTTADPLATTTTADTTDPGTTTAIDTLTTVDTTTGDATTSTTGDATTSSTTSSTTGGSTTTGSTTDTTDTTGDPPPFCGPLLQGFTDPPIPSGWDRCGDQLPHRAAAVACAVPATPSACPPDIQGDCETNADCTDHPFGSCQIETGFCGCIYGCETDADCAPTHVCRCGGDGLGDFTTCVPSQCTTDADCAGERCQFSTSWGDGCGFSVTKGACTTASDLCDDDLACGGQLCMWQEGWEFWACGGPVCGRPLLVDDRPVTAPAALRGDWHTPLLVALAPLALRPALAAHWTAIALAEHASVASFAVFLLQLTAVGAPPDLILAAQQALADEVDHARVAFAHATAYAGRPVGPGPLPLPPGPIAADLDIVLAAAIREACVAETLSALEVRESATRAEDPGLRMHLARIAADEQRHAELGWRFVRWALTHADHDRRARARAAFTAAIAAATADADRLARAPGTPELRPHGVVDPPLRAAVWRAALADLVAPTADLLCAA